MSATESESSSHRFPNGVEVLVTTKDTREVILELPNFQAMIPAKSITVTIRWGEESGLGILTSFKGSGLDGEYTAWSPDRPLPV